MIFFILTIFSLGCSYIGSTLSLRFNKDISYYTAIVSSVLISIAFNSYFGIPFVNMLLYFFTLSYSIYSFFMIVISKSKLWIKIVCGVITIIGLLFYSNNIEKQIKHKNFNEIEKKYTSQIDSLNTKIETMVLEIEETKKLIEEGKSQEAIDFFKKIGLYNE